MLPKNNQFGNACRKKFAQGFGAAQLAQPSDRIQGMAGLLARELIKRRPSYFCLSSIPATAAKDADLVLELALEQVRAAGVNPPIVVGGKR